MPIIARVKAAPVKHATAIAGQRTVCGRELTPRIAVDDGFPDCKRCLRAIAKVCLP